MDDDDVFAPPPEARETGRRGWSTLQVVLMSLAGLLVVGGIVVGGIILFVIAAANSYASNK
jgi:hypothetical protein